MNPNTKVRASKFVHVFDDDFFEQMYNNTESLESYKYKLPPA